MKNKEIEDLKKQFELREETLKLIAEAITRMTRILERQQRQIDQLDIYVSQLMEKDK